MGGLGDDKLVSLLLDLAIVGTDRLAPEGVIIVLTDKDCDMDEEEADGVSGANDGAESLGGEFWKPHKEI